MLRADDGLAVGGVEREIGADGRERVQGRGPGTAAPVRHGERNASREGGRAGKQGGERGGGGQGASRARRERRGERKRPWHAAGEGAQGKRHGLGLESLRARKHAGARVMEAGL